ncbi:hypothetical protein D1164_23110 [Mariniphaga sediminis]|jgi:hypothetical protein|uniref:DUF4468 domain-containing protein n=1 Tax=Mariniphaga sediminis TaxID=1628158 RepID=A0A399CTY9_9BACT|nr:hypothetical protein [Mariniphaga sediminis]RIH62796.1 hypothetical protein D1164_23110 [Mariniphaga sediminis]
MKAKMYFLSICVLLLCAAVSTQAKDGQALTGNSFTGFGKYVIMEAEVPMMIDNQTVKTYEVEYENAASPVRIGVIKEMNCITFLVRTNEFEVQYSCEKGVFGVKKMNHEYRELPEKECNLKLDKTSFYSQRIISRQNKTDEELLGLIACYFPSLVDEQYHSQL